MATAGTLDLVLSANSSQLRQELGRVRQESQTTALAVANLFSNDTISAASFKIARGTIVGLINDIDEMNQGLSISESLTRNLSASFNDLGDIALLQLGQIAQFLGEDLFEGPLAGLQSAALGDLGLGQLEGAFQIVSAGANAAKLAAPALQGLQLGFSAVDEVLGNLEGNIRTVSQFFSSIAGNAKLASTVLVAVADSIDDAIEQLLNTLAELNPAFKAARDAVKSLGLEYSLGQVILGDYINDLDKVEQVAADSSQALNQVADATNNAQKGIKRAGNAVEDFGQKLQRQRKTAEQFQDGMKALADAGFLFRSWQQASDIVDQFFGSLGDTFNAAKSAENLANRLAVTSTSARGAAEDLEFLTRLTDDLGTNFNATAEGFAQFSAATQQTNLRSEQTKEIFEDVAQAAAVMRLSAADTEGVFLALRQSLSGGNIQLEELNQLAERLPGTFQAAASALGVTTGELRALVSTGKVASEDFIPKFAAQLAANTQSGVVGAANSGEAAVNRFNNALGTLQVEMGKAWLEVGTPALNIFADALLIAAENEELLSSAIDALLVLAVVKGAAAIFFLTKAVLTNGIAFNFLGKQIEATGGQIKAYTAGTLLAYAALLLFFRALDQYKDSAQSTRTAIASLQGSLREIEEASGRASSAIANVLPKDPPPTDFFDSIIHNMKKLEEEGGLAGKGLAFVLSKTVVGALTNVNRAVNFLKTGKFELVTNAQNQLNDLRAALDDLEPVTQRVLGESASFRKTAQNGGGPLAEIKEIDAALKRLENRKLDLDPKNADGIKRVREEEDALLKRRADAQKQITSIQAANSNALAQYEQQLQNIDPALASETAEKERARIQLQIDLITKEKLAFEELTNTAANTAQKVADEFEQSSHRLEVAFQDTQAAIAEALASGAIDEEQYRKQSLDAERKFLEDKLSLNQEKLAELKAELEKNAKLRAIDPKSAFLNADQEKQYKQQVEKLELETSQTRIQLAQKVVEGKRVATEQELDNIRSANEKAEALTRKAETDRIAAIRERQLAGQLSEEAAAKAIEQARSEAIASEVQLTKQRLSQVAQLKAEGKLSDKEASAEELSLNQKLSDLNLQRIEQELQAREAAKREVLAGLEEINAKADASLSQFRSGKVASIKTAQLGGDISEEDAARQIEAVEQEVTQQQIASIKNRIAQTRKLRLDGVLSSKEAADREQTQLQELASTEERLLDQRLAAQRRVREENLREIEEANAKAEALIEQSQQDRITAIKQAQAAGDYGTGEDAEIKVQQAIAAIQKETTDDLIEQKGRELDEVDSLRAQNLISEEEAQKRQLALNQEIGSLNLQRIEQELEAQQQLRDERLQASEEAQQQARSDVDLSQQERINAVKRAELEGVLAAEEAAEQITQIRQEGTEQDAALLNQQMAETKRLADEKVISEKEATRRQRELKLELARLDERLVDDEVARRRAVAEVGKANLQQEKDRIDIAAQGLDLEKQRLDLANQSLERSNSLLQSRYDLQRAIASATIAQSEGEVEGLNRALEIRKQLDEGVEDAGLKQALGAELQALGVGANSSALDILRKRQDAEDQIARKQIEALQLEQNLQREKNRLEEESLRIRGQQLILEAQMTAAKQQQARLQAEQNVLDAEATGDPRKIDNAEKLLELARTGEELSLKQLDNAIAQQQAESEKAANARRVQEVEQSIALQKAFANNGTRERAQGIELAQFAKGDAGALRQAIAQIQGNPLQGMQLPQSVSRVPELQQLQLPTLSLNPDSLKAANQGIEEKLERLITATQNTGPKNVTFATPNPVEDYLRYESERNRVGVK